MRYSAGKRTEHSEMLVEKAKKKKKGKIKAKVHAFHHGTNFVCSLLAASI